MARSIFRIWAHGDRKSRVHRRSSFAPWTEANYTGAMLRNALSGLPWSSEVVRKGGAMAQARRGQVRTGTHTTSTGGRRRASRVQSEYQWVKVRRSTPIRKRSR